ncbi:MAG: ankyrin repeat domain-containing protein [Alphaproteobacteria bacterium]
MQTELNQKLLDAVKDGNIEGAKDALNKGADFNHQDEYGNTVLGIARQKNNPGIVRVLYNERIKLNEKLYNATKAHDVKLVREALNKGANIDFRDKEGNDINILLDVAAKYGYIEILELILSKYNDPELASQALIVAANFGRIDTVKLLLNKNACTKAKDKSSQTALHYAVEWGYIYIVKLLLDRDIEIEAKDNEGKTALFYAASKDRMEIIKLLLSKNFNINFRCADGRTIAHITSSEETLKYLITQGLDVTIKNNKNETALHYAVRRNDTGTIKLLLDQGVNINDKDTDGKTALHHAVFGGNTDIIKLLLDNNAEINAKDNKDKTALHNIFFNSFETVELLLSKGADIAAKDVEGTTVLHRAAYLHHTKTVELILRHGANINIKNINGKTAIDLIFDKNFDCLKILEILASYGARIDPNSLKYLNNEELSRLQELSSDYARKAGAKLLDQTILFLQNKILPKDISKHIAFYVAEDIVPNDKVTKIIDSVDKAIENRSKKLKEAERKKYIFDFKERILKQEQALAKDLHKALRENNITEMDRLFSLGINPHIRTVDNKNILKLIQQDGIRSFPAKLSNYFLSFAFRLNAYKTYNKVKDYIYAYNLAEKRINKKIDAKLDLLLKEIYAQDISNLDQIMTNLKLGNSYISNSLKQHSEIIIEYIECTKELHYKADAIWERLATNLRNELDHLSLVDKRTVRATEIDKILNNKRANKEVNPTYSKKALEDANWKGYRTVSWVEYAISFLFRVNEYIEYNKVRTERDAYNTGLENKISKNLGTDNKVENNIINENNKAIIEEAKVKYNEGNVKIKVPFTHLSIYGTGALKKKFAVKNAKAKIIEDKYQENWGEYIRNTYEHGQDKAQAFVSHTASLLNPKNYFCKSR